MHLNVEIVFDQRVMMGDTQRRSVTPCLFTVNPIARQKPRFRSLIHPIAGSQCEKALLVPSPALRWALERLRADRGCE
jgi:hypothetical protein